VYQLAGGPTPDPGSLPALKINIEGRKKEGEKESGK
jgi:hypothetical protein